MKHTIKTIFASVLLLSLGATSCDSFLDRQEDETMTFEKIWEQRSTTQQYFFNVMGYLPNDSQIFYYRHECGASDEGTCTWNWNNYQLINFGYLGLFL